MQLNIIISTRIRRLWLTMVYCLCCSIVIVERWKHFHTQVDLSYLNTRALQSYTSISDYIRMPIGLQAILFKTEKGSSNAQMRQRYQLSVGSCQLTVVSWQLAVVSWQLAVVSCQLVVTLSINLFFMLIT